MNQKQAKTKNVYEKPYAEIIKLSGKDIVSTSGPKDNNQGGWDPQNYSSYSVY